MHYLCWLSLSLCILHSDSMELAMSNVEISVMTVTNIRIGWDGWYEICRVTKLYCQGLYSGRAEHFWTKGAPNLTKIFLVLQYMEKLRSSPSEHFLVIRVCQKWQKCKNSEKPGFSGNCGYISKMVRSIFMNFWQKTPLTINKRVGKNFFQIF